MADNSNIIFVGTGHILEKSIKDVKETIDREKPDIVAIELCKLRYKALKGEIKDIPVKRKLKGGNIFLMLSYWLFSFVQKKIGAEFGVEPGAEMLAAIKKAEEHSCEIELVDRDIGITMQRFWKSMKFLEKIKMISSMIFAIAYISVGIGGEKEKKKMMGIEIERITDDDVVSVLIKELRKFSPGAATTLLDERDAYIASRLLEISKEKGEKRIVAVVGAGHIAGIKKYLEKPELILPKRMFNNRINLR